MDERIPKNAGDTTGAGIDEAIMHGGGLSPEGAATASPATPEMRSFDRYHEDIDDGSMNEQEHERRSHAHAQECRDCAPDGRL